MPAFRHSTEENPHRVRIEVQAAKELCIKLSNGYSFLSLASDVFLFSSLSAQPPTFRDSQIALRLQAGKSWKIGIYSPSKLESDFVLAISLKLSHANLVRLQNWCFILSYVFRRFSVSLNLCVRVSGWMQVQFSHLISVPVWSVLQCSLRHSEPT